MKTQEREKNPRFMGAISLLTGAYICAGAAGVIPINEAALHVPHWVFFMVGVVFLVGGVMVLLGGNSKVNDLLAFVVLASFGLVFFWVAFFSSPNSISGGIPFLPRPYSNFVNRSMFGLVAALSFAMSVYALRRHIKRRA